jgi:hypothetical protein
VYKNHKKMIETTERSARELAYALDSLTWTKYFGDLVEMCLAEEKAHRGGIGGTFAQHHRHAPGPVTTARWWAVHRIGEYLNGRAAPGGADFLHCQKSIFQAAAIVAECGDQCRAAIEKAGTTPEYLAGLGYCVLVSPEDVKESAEVVG